MLTLVRHCPRCVQNFLRKNTFFFKFQCTGIELLRLSQVVSPRDGGPTSLLFCTTKHEMYRCGFHLGSVCFCLAQK